MLVVVADGELDGIVRQFEHQRILLAGDTLEFPRRMSILDKVGHTETLSCANAPASRSSVNVRTVVPVHLSVFALLYAPEDRALSLHLDAPATQDE